MTANSKTETEQAVGRVVVAPDSHNEFLLFKPFKENRSQKILQGSMWFDREDPNGGTIWQAAFSIEALEWLRDNLGPLKLHPDVYRILRASEIVNPIPEISNLPLYDYQREAVGFLIDRSRAMLSLSPGLGKTLVSSVAASLQHDIRRILVVAPASLLFMWKGELEKWGPNLPRKPHAVVWHGDPKKYVKTDVPAGEQKWVISNPETVVRRKDFFLNQRFDLLILDESILYKNRQAIRTRTMTNIAKSIPRVWELTGSPATRMLDDLWSQFHLLRPRAYSSYWRFAEEYCIVSETPWAKQLMANKMKAEETIKRRFRDIYFARSQEEVLNIPDWLFHDIDVPMTSQQEKHYRELATQLRTELRDEQNNSTVINITNHLAKVVRLIQVASNPMLLGGKNTSGKWDAVPELVNFHEGPFIFWTSFIDSTKAITEMLSKLGLKTAFMLGETKPEDRQGVVNSFQSGKLDAVVLGQAVGSFGLTLTAARTAFYMERNYDGSYFQSLYRIRRIGTTRSPVVVHLRSVTQSGDPTIDQLVHQMLDYRVGMIKKLTVGMVLDIL